MTLLDTPDLFQLAASLLFPLRASSVLDLGSSCRPCKLILNPTRHVCADPCQEALDRLKGDRRYECWNLEAKYALGQTPRGTFDAIVLLDVIEHMEKDEGRAILDECLRKAAKTVVVFTPYGFVPQEPHEPGGEWQRHRSGWTPDDFPGRWAFLIGHHAEGLDPQNEAGTQPRSEPVRCFFAIWFKH